MHRSILAIALLSAAVACTSQNANPVLTVEGGKIQGVAQGDKGVTVYKGIPYAAAPVGELRWREPQPVSPWDTVRICDKFGAPSIQANHTPGGYTPEFFFDGDPEFSEDCLYLNVWTTKAGKTDAKLPVCLWIHGGGYSAGWGHEPEMDGTAWAEHGVVLVTFNYRLGILGFLTHPLLSAESEHGVSGNYGMLDQIAALKWVKANIAQFGGDPDKVTIMGQSAGAFSVKTLVTSPLSKDLVAGAIIQSGGGVSDTPILGGMPLAESEAIGKEIMDWAGYETLEQMRAASAQEIAGVMTRYMAEKKQWIRACGSPCIDGYALPESFDQAAQEGAISNVPYMIGATLDDMTGLDKGIERFCALRDSAGIPAYFYHFDRRLPTDGREGVLVGAFHSSELWYTFSTLDSCWRPFTQGDHELAEQMTSCWTEFVKKGDPNYAGVPEWTPWTASSPEMMSFQLDDQDHVASAMKPVE